MSTLDSYESNASLVVTLRIPRIDVRAATAFRAEAVALVEGRTNVLFLMDGIETVDSSGLGSLVAVFKAVAPGMKLRLVGVRPAVRKVLALTRIDTLCAQFDDLAAALAA